jgi:hypothetical protein
MVDQDSDASAREHYQPGLRVKINIRPRKRFGAIDVPLFHKPEIDNSTSRTIRQPLIPSDGFEGREAAPIGLYMPVKAPARRREQYEKITFRLGQLTLVPERRSEEGQVESHYLPRRRKRQRRITNATPNTHAYLESAPCDRGQRESSALPLGLELSLLSNTEVEHDPGYELIDGPGEEREAVVGVFAKTQPPQKNILQGPHMPTVPSIGNLSKTFTHLVFPPQPKQSAAHNYTPKGEKSYISQESDSQRLQWYLAGGDNIRISQQFVATLVNKRPLKFRKN